MAKADSDMSKKGRKFRSAGLLAALALLFFLGAAAATYYVASGGKAAKPEKKRSEPSPAVVTFVSERRKVTIFLPTTRGKRVYLAPVTVKTEAKGSMLDAALAALISAGHEGGQAPGLIPEGTKVVKRVKVDGDVATVDLSQEFIDNFSGGSDQEALTLNSIVHTLVSNSGGEVRKVRILVEGEAVESLGGHFELTDPIEADSTLLAPR